MTTDSATVIVSHYNAWQTDKLFALLDQMAEIPAGYPFRVRIVVNRAEDRPLVLPPRHAAAEVFYRENTGYNIGAWEYGWRVPGPGNVFLFLPQECVILKPNWLRAFVRRISDPGVGLVGESLALWSSAWEQVDQGTSWAGRGVTVFGRSLSWSQGVKTFLAAHNIAPGVYADHLQSLIICTRRDVLERVGGFPCGGNKDEAICSEVAVSKRVQAAGLKVRQLAFRPFRYIHHPQWDEDRRAADRVSWWLPRAVNLYLPRGITRRLRRSGRTSPSAGPANGGASGESRPG